MRIFAVPYTKQGGLPFLKACVRQLENYGILEQGIFRVPGSTTTIQRLKKAWDKGYDVGLKAMLAEDVVPHDIASLFKLYLRELPEPICTFDLYNCFIATHTRISETSEVDRRRWLIRSVSLLPEDNLEALRYIMCFLSRVAAHSEENSMGDSNLAVVFAPSLLRSPSESAVTVLMDAPVATLLFTNMIRSCRYIFQESALSGTKAQAVDDYEPHNSSELSVKKGQRVIILAECDESGASDWWKVELEGNRGYVPAVYFEPIDDSVGEEDTGGSSEDVSDVAKMRVDESKKAVEDRFGIISCSQSFTEHNRVHIPDKRFSMFSSSSLTGSGGSLPNISSDYDHIVKDKSSVGKRLSAKLTSSFTKKKKERRESAKLKSIQSESTTTSPTTQRKLALLMSPDSFKIEMEKEALKFRTCSNRALAREQERFLTNIDSEDVNVTDLKIKKKKCKTTAASLFASVSVPESEVSISIDDASDNSSGEEPVLTSKFLSVLTERAARVRDGEFDLFGDLDSDAAAWLAGGSTADHEDS